MPRRFWLRSLLVLAACSCWLACGGAEPAPPASLPIGSPASPVLAPGEVPTGKLPSGVKPLAYRLELSIVPDRDRFAGVVEIDLQVDQPTQRIYLHALSLSVTSVDVRSSDGATVPAVFRVFDNSGVAALELEAPIAAGRYMTRIVYDAPFDHQLKGLYRVHAGDQDYAFTQFEAIAARQAFPCFDEPRFKTPFDVRLTVRATDRAIANTTEIGA
jgi:alanyl aminopeptidase